LSISRLRLRWGLVGLLAAAVGVAVFATQPRPLYADASGFIVIGRGFLSGQAPYLGLFDDKPPGVYLVGTLAWLLDPGDITVSMQALSVVAIAIAATACGWLVSAVYERFWVGVATAIVVAGGLSLPALDAGGGGSELFGVAGLAVCVAAIGAMILRRRSLIWPVAAGAGLAWAIGSSLLTLGAVPAVALLWLSIPVDDEPLRLSRFNWRTWVRRRLADRRLAAAICGTGAVSLVLWLPVIATGSMSAAFDAFLRYNGLYRATGVLKLRDWMNGVGSFWPLWLPTLAVCLVPTARRQLLGLTLVRSNLARAMVLWLVVGVALLMFGRRFYPHYLLLLVPPLAVLFGVTLCSLWLDRPTIIRRVVGLTLCLVVVVGLAWQSPPAASNDSRLAANAQLADYIRANSAPADTIYVWGYDPDLYLRADRDPAGPYFVIVPLIMPGYDGQAVATMLGAWQAHPPRLVVTGRSDAPDLVRLDPLIVPQDKTNPGEPSDYAALDPLRAFVQAHYDPVATLQAGQVWRYRG
jgi:hypothetical protein